MALPAVDSLTAGGAVPWTIAFTQRLGRHVTATRDISAGAATISCFSSRVPVESPKASCSFLLATVPCVLAKSSQT